MLPSVRCRTVCRALVQGRWNGNVCQWNLREKRGMTSSSSFATWPRAFPWFFKTLICYLQKSQKESSIEFKCYTHTMSDVLCKSVPLSHFVGSIQKRFSIRFVKFSCDGASDRGRGRTGRRLCCQHRAGVRWQGGLGGQVCLLRWKFHQGNQRHQRCRDTDPEDQEGWGDLQC